MDTDNLPPDGQSVELNLIRKINESLDLFWTVEFRISRLRTRI